MSSSAGMSLGAPVGQLGAHHPERLDVKVRLAAGDRRGTPNDTPPASAYVTTIQQPQATDIQSSFTVV